jgi:hypothetical protein
VGDVTNGDVTPRTAPDLPPQVPGKEEAVPLRRAIVPGDGSDRAGGERVAALRVARSVTGVEPFLAGG